MVVEVVVLGGTVVLDVVVVLVVLVGTTAVDDVVVGNEGDVSASAAEQAAKISAAPATRTLRSAISRRNMSTDQGTDSARDVVVTRKRPAERPDFIA
ncbi:MAG: hypothetical protein ACO28Q_04500 [Ilumatobacteraceae bacterium]